MHRYTGDSGIKAKLRRKTTGSIDDVSESTFTSVIKLPAKNNFYIVNLDLGLNLKRWT